MNDSLSLLWPHLDSESPLFSERAFAPWPGDHFQQLIELGFLCPTMSADTVTCPECGDHVEEVIAFARDSGITEYFIPCPELMRARVPPELLRQWTIDFGPLLRAVAASLSLRGQLAELVPGRLWRLGRTPWHGVSRDVLFVRGLNWPDRRTVTSQAVHATRPIILVPHRVPPPDTWPGRVPPIVVLSQVATLRGESLEVDHEAVFAAVMEADASSHSPAPTLIGADQLKLLIRQQVKVEQGAQLTDDILVAAYRQEGSVRKAATWLSGRTGQPVTKDKVQAAVLRAGGAGAVARNGDSQSVVRTVVSHRRDRSKKLPKNTQPQESQQLKH